MKRITEAGKKHIPEVFIPYDSIDFDPSARKFTLRHNGVAMCEFISKTHMEEGDVYCLTGVEGRVKVEMILNDH